MISCPAYTSVRQMEGWTRKSFPCEQCLPSRASSAYWLSCESMPVWFASIEYLASSGSKRLGLILRPWYSCCTGWWSVLREYNDQSKDSLTPFNPWDLVCALIVIIALIYPWSNPRRNGLLVLMQWDISFCYIPFSLHNYSPFRQWGSVQCSSVEFRIRSSKIQEELFIGFFH